MAELSIDDLPEIMTLADAAQRVGMSVTTLRKEIKAGALVAFIPRGREPLRAGPGLGYRITKQALTSWYFRQPE